MRILSLFLLLSLFSAVSPAQSIKVMTYNIRLDTPADSANQWPRRADKVSALIRKHNPDILGIQEAIHHQLTDLLKNLPQYSFIGVGRDDGKTKGEYSAILYKNDRFTVSAQSTFWLSETPDVPGSKSWDAAITRVASWGRLIDENTKVELLIINTHFDHIGTMARTKSAELIKHAATNLGLNIPVIITGDFNCTREESPYAAIMGPQGIVLTDPAPVTAPGTYCGFKVSGFACKAIDYIFCSRHWSPSLYTVVQDNDGKYYPSDHLPVMTTLVLKK